MHTAAWPRRDVVARSIYHEMLSQDVPNVYLDLRSCIPEQRIRGALPTMYAECLKYGVDMTRDLVPWSPLRTMPVVASR